MVTSYVDALKAQLTNYKLRELLVAEEGLWVQNGRAYAHILPPSAGDLNLCAPLRAELQALIATNTKWKKHRDFRHLNSSQAMCWNVLMPAAVLPSGLEHLGQAVGTSSSIVSLDFEVVPDREEQTSFDCVMRLADGGTVYVEAKLTEREFGVAGMNKQREGKRTGTYRPRLEGKVAPGLLEERSFFANYQLLRNLSHLTRATDRLVLLLPRANTDLVRQAAMFREYVSAPWQAQLSMVFVEDLIERLAALASGPARLHFEECGRKYVLR